MSVLAAGTGLRPRSGSRSSGATSSGTCCTSAACTSMGGCARPARRRARFRGSCRSPPASSRRSPPSRPDRHAAAVPGLEGRAHQPAQLAPRRLERRREGRRIEHRTPYALRHTFASFAIAAGIATFEIARMIGTSIEQIEKTYGHLLPDALDRGRAALEAFDAPRVESFGH